MPPMPPVATAVRLMLLVVLGVSSAGCQVIGDIFQAGIWAGVVLVLLFLGGMAFLASKFRSGPR